MLYLIPEESPLSKKFRVGIVARLKQGDLLDALTKRGWSQSDAARFLGVTPTVFGNWINMTSIPKSFTAEMTIKLYELTSKTPEELFPEFVRSEKFRETKTGRKTFTFDADPDRMIGSKEMLRLEASPQTTPDGILTKKELVDKINDVLRTLTPREEKIVRDHILEDVPLDQIDRENRLPDGTARRLVARGLRRLRNPENASRLRDLL